MILQLFDFCSAISILTKHFSSFTSMDVFSAIKDWKKQIMSSQVIASLKFDKM